MSYRFEVGEPVAKAVRRVASEEIAAAIEDLQAPTEARHEAVHEVRKRCKKLRGLLRLVREPIGGAYSDENRFYRDIGRRLSGTRDAEALIECVDKLRESVAGEADLAMVEVLRQNLVHRRDAVYHGESGLEDLMADVAKAFEGAAARVTGWGLKRRGFGLLEAGLGRIYERGRRAMALAGKAPSPEHFHEWRKQVKYHWCHARLLGGVWADAQKDYPDDLKRLSDFLGDDHDLHVLEETLAADPEGFGGKDAVTRLGEHIARRREAMEAQAIESGKWIFMETPEVFVGRVRLSWETWRGDEG